MNTRGSSGSRFFSDIFNVQKAEPSMQYLFDGSALINFPNGGIKTGAWRPIVPADLAANISLSGVSLSVGSVAVTGVTQTSIVGIPHVVVDGGLIGLTGNLVFAQTGVTPVTIIGGATSSASVWLTGANSISTAYTGSNSLAAPQPISGVVTIAGGINSSSSTVLTGSNSVSVIYTGSSLTANPLPVSGGINILNTPNVAITNTPTVTLSNPQTFVGVTGVVNANATIVGTPTFLIGNQAGITGQPLNVTGSLSITPAPITPISGFVTLTNPGASSSAVLLTGQSYQVSVSNYLTGFSPILPPLPVSGLLSIAAPAITPTSGFSTINNTAPIPVSGSMVVLNQLAIQAVSGLTTLTNPPYQFLLTGANSVSVNNFPTSENFSLTGFSPTLPPLPTSGIMKIDSIVPINVSGNLLLNGTFQIDHVAVTGLVNTIASGTGFVNITNLPAIQAVSGLVTITNPGASSSTTLLTGQSYQISVSNYLTGFSPTLAPLPVSGSLSVTPAPITPVSGIIKIDSSIPINVSGNLGLTGILSLSSVALSGTGFVNVVNQVFQVQITGWTGSFGGSSSSSTTQITGQTYQISVSNYLTGFSPTLAPLPVSGALSITPAAITAISGVVKIDPTQAVNVTGIFSLSGTLQINNVAVTGLVNTLASGTGFVNVTNFPSLQAISGFITSSNPIYQIGITGLPLFVTGNVIAVQTGVMPVLVSNFPVLQATSGFSTITNPVYQVQITGWTGSFGGSASSYTTQITGQTYQISVSDYLTGFSPTLAPLPVSGALSITPAAITAISGITKIDSSIPVNVSGSLMLTGTIQIDNVAVTGVTLITGAQLTFGFNITGFSVGQMQIPAGAVSYSIALTSGTGFVGGFLLSSPTSLGGGGYASNFRLGNAINCGTSGGNFLVTWEV